jgi:phosphatidate cytidylyltransferase
MLQRIISGVVALAIVLPVLLMGGVDGAKVLVGAVLLVVMHEFGAVASPQRPRAATIVMSVVGLSIYGVLSWGQRPELVGVVMVLGTAVLLTWAMFAHEDPKEAALCGAVTALSVPYIAAALAFIGLVRGFGSDELGLSWVLYVLVATWATDTGAYCSGRFLGRKKLLVRISPKKTWAGVWGGVAVAVAVSVGWSMQWSIMPLGHAAVLGGVLAISGVVGDLVESMFKRARGIKDSGGIMPGHGGLFDRVDSLLFTMPVAWAYAVIFGLV